MILPFLRRGCVGLAFTLSALLSLAWSPTGHMVGGNAECGMRIAESEGIALAGYRLAAVLNGIFK